MCNELYLKKQLLKKKIIKLIQYSNGRTEVVKTTFKEINIKTEDIHYSTKSMMSPLPMLSNRSENSSP